MASDPDYAPPTGGGNLKYAILGFVLLLGAGAVYFGTRGCEDGAGATAEVRPDAGAASNVRSRALANDDLLIADEPDSGPQVDAGPRRIRYVTRYVGGGSEPNMGCENAGDIPRGAVENAVAGHRVQFRNCYERRLKANNQLEGRVSVMMRVGRTGSVERVQVGGTLRDSDVLSCVRSVARQVQFPAPSGGTCALVSVPFNFAPQQ